MIVMVLSIMLFLNIIYGSKNIEQDNLILFSSTTEFFNTFCYLEVCSLTK